jgi:hypothetical protein
MSSVVRFWELNFRAPQPQRLFMLDYGVTSLCVGVAYLNTLFRISHDRSHVTISILTCRKFALAF